MLLDVDDAVTYDPIMLISAWESSLFNEIVHANVRSTETFSHFHQ